MQILLFHVLLEFTGRLPELIDFLGLLGSLLELMDHFWSCWIAFGVAGSDLMDRIGGFAPRRWSQAFRGNWLVSSIVYSSAWPIVVPIFK